MANLRRHEAGNGGYSQGEPTGTAPVLDPTVRGGDGNACLCRHGRQVGIIRSPVRAIALPDCDRPQHADNCIARAKRRRACAPTGLSV